MGGRGVKAVKGGKVSAKARRALLSENDLSPARCPPVFVCVPVRPPKPNICATVMCMKPICKRGERLLKADPSKGNCCGKCVPMVPRICCQAMTAQCLACKSGVSVSEYCKKNPSAAGCKRSPSPIFPGIPSPGPGPRPPVPCKVYRIKCARGKSIKYIKLKNGCTKPTCVPGRPFPLPSPGPCPKSVRRCPKGQKRVLKRSSSVGYGRGVKAVKGGKVSAKARRALLSENGDLPPEPRCPPVFVCVPVRPPKPNICATVMCMKPICKRGERLLKADPSKGNCCGKCVPMVPRICCQAMTAQCLACKSGVSVSEYCKKNPSAAGCKRLPSPIFPGI